MASFGSDLKKAAIKNIGSSLMGRGVLGQALGKSFMRKFGASKEADPVEDAINEQTNEHLVTQSTLHRIETIVTNISDNIYNLTGVWSKYVVSLEETKRAQKEQASRDAAAAEEAANEAAAMRESGPSVSASSTEETKSKKGGILSQLIGSVGKTKSLLGAFVKKFGLLLGGGALAIGALAYSGSANAENVDASREQTPSEETSQEQTQAEPVSTPTTTSVSPPEQEDAVSQFTSMIAKKGGPEGEKHSAFLGSLFSAAQKGDNVSSIAGMMQKHAQENPPPAATQVATPQPATTAPAPAPAAASETDPQQLIKQYQSNIDANNARLANREESSKRRVESWKKRYADDPERLNDLLEKDKIGMDDYRNMVATSNKDILEKIDNLKKAGSGSSSTGGGATMASGGGGSGGGSSSGASPAPSGPTIGSEIGNASASVAAANEAPTTPSVVSNVSNGSSPAVGTKTSIPSPIADRGSLDVNTTFRSGG